MSTRADYRILEADGGGDESLRVHEAAGLGVLEARSGSVFRDDGAVKITIIRPCKGRGRGSHVYEGDMLRREAPKFKGWPMFIDHEPPEETRRKGGLPPSIFKLGGEVLESWWDGSVPPEGRFDQGAVMGWALPSPWMKPVIEAHPRLVGASLNTFATGVKPRRGQRGIDNVVEGFVDDGSVDWVTKAGAGGGVVLEAVQEAAVDVSDDDVATWLREHRPVVVEALLNTNSPGKSGRSEQEDDDVDPKQLMEAFNALSDEQRQEFATAILESENGTAAVASAVDDRLKDVLPRALEAAGAKIEEAALAKVDERLSHGSLMEAARERLDAAELVAWAREDAWALVSEGEFKAVEPDAEGKGGKTAREVMEAAVDAQIARVKKIQEAAGVKAEDAKPRVRTAVVGNGGGGSETDEHEVREADDGRDSRDGWEHALQEAAIGLDAWGAKDPDKADKDGKTTPDKDEGGDA